MDELHCQAYGEGSLTQLPFVSTSGLLKTYKPLLVLLKIAFPKVSLLAFISDPSLTHTFSIFNPSSLLPHAKPPTWCFGSQPRTIQNASHRDSWAFLIVSYG